MPKDKIMLHELIFQKVHYENVFMESFQDMKSNHKIQFDTNKHIAIIYAPNGTGKTTISKLLGQMLDQGSIEVLYDNIPYTNKNITNLCHVIQDHYGRNIIKGDTEEFFLGDNIRKETQLKNEIDKDCKTIYTRFKDVLKTNYQIKTKDPLIFTFAKDLTSQCKKIISTVANSKGSVDNIATKDFITIFEENKKLSSPFPKLEENENEIQFVINELATKNNIFEILLNLDISTETTDTTKNVTTYQKTEYAITVLKKYPQETECIVCDHAIDSSTTLHKKQKLHSEIVTRLTENIHKIIKWDDKREHPDPFMIKDTILKDIESKDCTSFNVLKQTLHEYLDVVVFRIKKSLIDLIQNTNIVNKIAEHEQLVSQQIDITEEDQLYIESIIQGILGQKSLTIERDAHKRIIIKFRDIKVLETDRDQLQLSTGEQNFLSMSFELLKAKNKPQPIVVIDDPISSFDSIYKNKMMYSIPFLLQNKQVLLFTHTTETIKLLKYQKSSCFEMYILHNIENENNGFIFVNSNENKLIIDSYDFLTLLRKIEDSIIINKELFLISMIPFMRGYANLINNCIIYEQLSKVMHGYEKDPIDIADIYHKLFEKKILCSFIISVNDIIKEEHQFPMTPIIDTTQYPLLNQTLQHNFMYLYLRILVENKLVSRFNISIPANKPLMLGTIISQAFSENNIDTRKKRVALMSKKTLLNDFNHFEGNLSIFQPALDIANNVLEKENHDIKALLYTL
ncbi:MAG: hypothetical protein ACRC0X_08540 [Brevinema sp.]